MFYEFKHPLRADYFAVQTGTDFSFPVHIHHCFELVAVTDGEMMISCDDKAYSLKAGEAVLVFPNQIHSLKSVEHSRHVLCLFSPNLVGAFLSLTQSHLPEDNRFVPDDYLIDKLKNTDDNCGILEKKGLLYALLSAFHKTAVYCKKRAHPDSLLFDIFRFIEDNCAGDCSLSALCEALSYEYTYLSHFFKKNVGMSYNDYVNEYRISRVCQILTDTDKTVLEISEECGFNSLRSLNRSFKKRLGCTPGSYRRAKTV